MSEAHRRRVAGREDKPAGPAVSVRLNTWTKLWLVLTVCYGMSAALISMIPPGLDRQIEREFGRMTKAVSGRAVRAQPVRELTRAVRDLADWVPRDLLGGGRNIAVLKSEKLDTGFAEYMRRIPSTLARFVLRGSLFFVIPAIFLVLFFISVFWIYEG